MSAVVRRQMAILAVFASMALLTPATQAQMPSPWKQAAPFPEPDEELYGVTANGKLYVIGGWGGGKARGVNYEYDPETDKWTKKKSMPRPAHHAAVASLNGKIYVCGGFIAPEKSQLPVGAAWEPIDDVSEYDPAVDSWKALAPLPSKRGAGVAVEAGGKIYMIGGVTTVEGSKEPFFTFLGAARDLTLNDVYDPQTNKWESRKPMSVGRNHAFAAEVNGKIYVIGGRIGHGFIMAASNTDVVEEYDPSTDKWSAPKERMPTARSGGGCGTDGKRIYVAGGEVTTKQVVGAMKAVEAYEPATNTWTSLPSMTIPRHGVAGGVIGNRLHLVSGMVQSSGSMAMLDPRIEVHTATHDVLELPDAKKDVKAEGVEPVQLKKYTRYDIKSPEGKKMLAKLARAIKTMREYPDYDPQSYTFWWYTHWIDGPSAHLYEESAKHKAKVIAQLPAKYQALADATWNSCQSHTQDPADPDRFRNDLFLPWHRHYLYHFEQMVREVLHDDDFSIPYWNPASGDPADQSLPAEFREEGPLYNTTRFPWVQAGEPLKMLLGNWISMNALNESFYIDKLNGNLGFCPQVDINPHFLVHLSTGGDLANGFVRVVNDPLFWVHHANIDRMWESWNRLGHENPTDPKWLDRKFTFADRKGQRVDVAVSAVNRLAQLGYEYDNYAQAPKPGSAPVAEKSPAKPNGDAKTKQPSPAPAFTLPDGTGKKLSLSQYQGRPVVVIFYRGYGCIQCMQQLNSFAQKASDFAELGIDLVAVSTDSPDDLKQSLVPYEKKGGFPFPLVSDEKLEVFKAFRCVDSDNSPLHGTFLIDAQGRIRFRDISDEPFNNPTLLLKEGKQLSSAPVTVNK